MRFFSRLIPLFFGFGFLFLPQLAFADQTAALLPSSDGHYLQWTPKSGSTHYTMVDETSCNGTTDYNQTTTVNSRDSYGVSLSSVPDGATISEIDITPCASRVSSGGSNPTMNVFYRLSGTDSSDAGSYSLTGTTPVGLATTSFTGLATIKASTSTLEIGAVLSAGTKGARLSQISTQITYTPLAAPSSLTASATDSSHVTLNWVDNSSNEDGFKIERSDNNGPFNQIATVGQNVTTYNDSGLAVGTYTYQVRAYNTGGNSGYTSTTTATTLAAPTNLSAVASGSAVFLTWTDNASNEAGFRIEFATNSGQFVLLKSVGANTTQYTDSNRTAANYTYRVQAYSGSNTSDYTNSSTATVLSAPTNFTAIYSASDSAVLLNWKDNSNSEDGYVINRSYNGGGFQLVTTTGQNAISFNDPNPVSGSYIYQIYAYKASNTSATASASVSVP